MIKLFKQGIYVPIGEQINHLGTVVECFVGEDNACTCCCFENNCSRQLICTSSDREDKTMVKFKEISKE